MGAPQFEQAGADISGTGTTNTIPRWTGPSTLGDSLLIQTSNAITMTSTVNARLDFGVRNLSNGGSAYSQLFAGNDTDVLAGLLRNSSGNAGYAGPNSLNLWTVGAYPIGFVTANQLRAIVDASGNVGIGTASPAAKVHSVIADGATYSYGASGTTKGFRVEHSAAETRIVGVDNTLNVTYQPLVLGGSTLGFNTGGTTRALTIDTTQQVGIGTASPGALLHLEKALGLTANAEIFRLRNSTVGSGSNVSQTFYVHGNSVATGNISHAWNGTTYDTIFSVWNGSALAEAGRAIGGSTPVLSVPSGLKLPATPGNADTQTLDCYQESTWTPTLAGFGGTNPTVTATLTRVGRLVTLTVQMQSTGGAQYSGTLGATTLTVPAGMTPNIPACTNLVNGAVQNLGNVAAYNDGLIYLPTFALTTAFTFFVVTYRV